MMMLYLDWKTTREINSNEFIIQYSFRRCGIY
jgi:hypothetical protein